MPNKQGYTNVDLDDPEIRQRGVRALVNQYEQTPSGILMRGQQWYPKVQAATEKGVREHFGSSLSSPLAGPGMVAAVSPNMDWDRNNIDAFGELARLPSHAWSAIESSAKQSSQARKYNKGLQEQRDAGVEGVPEDAPTGRSTRAWAALQGLGIAKAPDANLLKANKIMQGVDPEKVITRGSAPKTHSFMHNIAGNDMYVTIDGRAHDMLVNQMRPWESGRGINSAALKTGGTTRYEHAEGIYKDAAKFITAHNVRTGQRVDLQPHHLQAILWEYGKHIERTMNTTPQRPNPTTGPKRVGQPYFPGADVLAPPRVTPRSEAAPAEAAPAIETAPARRTRTERTPAKKAPAKKAAAPVATTTPPPGSTPQQAQASPAAEPVLGAGRSRAARRRSPVPSG